MLYQDELFWIAKEWYYNAVVLTIIDCELATTGSPRTLLKKWCEYDGGIDAEKKHGWIGHLNFPDRTINK
jgi:hypothetical protein